MQENIDDIVNDIRGNAEHNHALVEVSKYLTEIADRIEAAHRIFYDKYKEHTNELNRQIIVLKHEKEMSDTYFCGYDPEEALVMQCSTCRFFQRKHQHFALNDSLTNARYKCSGWKFKTNKECADEYNASRNHEVAELREENARLRAALKPVLDEHIPDFSICDTCYDRSECKGHEYDVKCEWYDIVESVRESQRIYKGGAK